MRIVIDTSALLAVLLGEPERGALIEATRGAQLCSPESLPWEVGNALSAMLKRRALDLTTASAVLKSYQQVPVQLVVVDLLAALQLASRFRIYAYDAYMLEAARSQQCALLTLDKTLKRVAREAQITLLEA